MDALMLIILTLGTIVLSLLLADLITLIFIFKAKGRALYVILGVFAVITFIIFMPLMESIDSIDWSKPGSLIDFSTIATTACLIKTFIIKQLLRESSFIKTFLILVAAFIIASSLIFLYLSSVIVSVV